VTGREVVYNASRTLSRFHLSDDFVRGVRGPVGSGKSTSMCWEMLSRSRRQKLAPGGQRKTRWVVVRNTYRELADTTLKTWLDWFPEQDMGEFSRGDMAHRIKIDDLDMEVLFRALDRPDDVKKVLSLELTGAWVNEAREIPKSIIDALGDRVGRYPARREGGCTWRGVIMDTNAPDDDHWWYKLAEEDRPEGWRFFTQPPGLIGQPGAWQTNPDAENLDNLEPGYYETRAAGKSTDYIKIYYCNEYGFVQEGRPVYSEYSDRVHCAAEPFGPVEGLTIYIGLDFGLTPAAVFGQRTPRGQWRIIDEMVSEDMGVVRFAEHLAQFVEERYSGFEFETWGDPAGNARSQVDERTCMEIVREYADLNADAAPTNDFTMRRESVAGALNRLVDGDPGFLISPACKVLRKGFAGGYAYKRVQVSGQERFHDRPDKNRFSHPHDALQYLVSGAGEHRVVMRQFARESNLPHATAAKEYSELDY